MPLLAVLLVASLLAGCGGGGVAPTAPLSPSPSAGGDPVGSWQLVEREGPGGPIVLVDDFPITLTISGSTITGRACNSYGASIVPVGEGIELRDLGMTAMACVNDGVMDAEAAYTAALQGVRDIGTEGEELVLTGPGIALRFVRLPDAPTAELVDTSWTLESLFVGDVAAAPLGAPATLLIRADGTFAGSTGCRAFDGTWVEQGGQLMATSMAMDGSECPPALTDQDSQVVSVIGDGFVPTVEGQLLTLTDPGGIGLVYRSGG